MPVLENDRHETFAQLRMKGLSLAAAYEGAGYKPSDAHSARLAGDGRVRARIEELKAAAAERTEISVANVLQELWAVATADARSLISSRKVCCRWCYGIGHRFQETPAEREARDRQHQQLLRATPEKRWHLISAFDELGGVGYDKRKPPVADCPECFGDGTDDVRMADIDRLSAAEARLYAGLEVGRDGVKIKLKDQVGALVKVGEHLGMFARKVEHGGPNGGPILTADVTERMALLEQLPPQLRAQLRPVLLALADMRTKT